MVGEAPEEAAVAVELVLVLLRRHHRLRAPPVATAIAAAPAKCVALVYSRAHVAVESRHIYHLLLVTVLREAAPHPRPAVGERLPARVLEGMPNRSVG